MATMQFYFLFSNELLAAIEDQILDGQTNDRVYPTAEKHFKDNNEACDLYCCPFNRAHRSTRLGHHEVRLECRLHIIWRSRIRPSANRDVRLTFVFIVKGSSYVLALEKNLCNENIRKHNRRGILKGGCYIRHDPDTVFDGNVKRWPVDAPTM
ncbi:uncharacterized protein LOC111267374 [Varroa jacobsoni]|uniref:uncharacterized protein LOC111267374 n=1 Tax=Varroa jacobsoni TaxID=62625 RepID=UPI000BF28621|nr:uncharacterized protein LOC111267374 [Varroa jacobsoni]